MAIQDITVSAEIRNQRGKVSDVVYNVRIDAQSKGDAFELLKLSSDIFLSLPDGRHTLTFRSYK